MIQHVLAKRYELLEHVGGGGMADVYRAHDTYLDRYVAIKILHAQFSNDSEFIGKFHREAQGAARLSHPNIVNIYDVGEEADKHFIVMEYVAGNTLKSKIQEMIKTKRFEPDTKKSAVFLHKMTFKMGHHTSNYNVIIINNTFGTAA